MCYGGGNVGIGTIDPISKLHVYTEDNSETALRIIRDGGSGSVLGKCGIGFRINKNITDSNNTYEDQGGIVMEEKDIADSQANVLFKIKQTSGYAVLPTTAMMIRYDGNVGIGTNNPNQKLHVVGDINFTGNIRHNGSIVNFSSGTTTSWNTAGLNTTSGDIQTTNATFIAGTVAGWVRNYYQDLCYWDSDNWTYYSWRGRESDLTSVLTIHILVRLITKFIQLGGIRLIQVAMVKILE